MTADIAALTSLVDRYIAVWNEADANRRQALIMLTFVEHASYLDPMLAGEGHDGINALVEAVHAKYPGYKFSRTSDVNAHHDRAQFDWQLAPGNGPALVKGLDFSIVSDDGRLKAVTGFYTELNMPQP